MYKILAGIMMNNSCDIVQFRYKETKQLPSDYNRHIDNVDVKIYDYAKDRKKYLLDSSILNESCTTKLYSSRLIAEAGVRYAENVAYEEPLFTYPLKFYADRVAVTQAQLYYYRYNENGTMLSYMNNPSTMVQHLQVQQDVYTRMSNSDIWMNSGMRLTCIFYIHFMQKHFILWQQEGCRCRLLC